jgi:uroporphyrinogen decarboxylase
VTRREVVKAVLEGKKPPYVPWSFGFTIEAREKLCAHFDVTELEGVLQNHLLGLGDGVGFFEDVGDNRVRDVFGVIWDRSVDKDIGVVEGCVLPEPTLAGYEFPRIWNGSEIATGSTRLGSPSMSGPGRCGA